MQIPDNYGSVARALTKTGNLFDNIIISVNGESAYPEQLAKPVKDGDELNIVFMISGG